jgi:integrase
MGKYKTIEEASQAAINLCIKGYDEYKERYKEDPKLPCSPSSTYKGIWGDFGRWYGYLGNPPPTPAYETIEEASQAAIKLGIKSQTQYRSRYKEDPKLRLEAYYTYKDAWDDFGAWYGFLGNEKSESFYETIEEASQAAIKLGIKSRTQYHNRYKEDPKLPSAPHNTYRDTWGDFGGMYVFLGNEKPESLYETIEEASQAAIKLGIKSQTQYHKRYKEDPKLPSAPDYTYRDAWNDFGRWYGYLDKERPTPVYETIEEASQASIKLGIKSRTQYHNRYKEDPKLPNEPQNTYKHAWNDFGAWYGFLGNIIPHNFGIGLYETIEEASQAAIKLGIKNMPQYHNRYKEDPKLPSAPQNTYKDAWDDFGKWYGFFGRKKPFTLEDIGKNYKHWGELLDLFLKKSERNISQKKRTCVAFICKFIIENNNSERPEDFLLKTTKINRKQYEAFLNYFGDIDKAKFHVIVLEFIDYCLFQLCSLEDKGEVIIHSGFRNPLNTFQSDLLDIKANKLSESDKPALAYTYVVKGREWIVPVEAKNFSDLTHLHNLMENDWFDVDPSLIDKSDPDCVYRHVEKDRRIGKHTGNLIGAHNEKVYQIWSPVRFLALYTLMSVPARGQQILWCDSGEADKRIPEFRNGKAEWVANTGLLAGRTNKQGFISEYPGNELGLHFTTNKTSHSEGGYDIPWSPDYFDYWMIKLRNWQSKYNPLTEPTKWTDLRVRHPIGSRILEQRGSNCFLFRQPNDTNPHQQPIFSNALAYVLHQIESQDNRLTTTTSNTGNVGSYKSEYTPHSMRVSLITAFIVDANVPIHIVSKLVGHARIAMTIYYTHVGHSEMREEMSAADKRALAAAPLRMQRDFRNGQFKKLRDSLVPNDLLTFHRLNNNHPPSAFSFSDIGICPMGGGKCEQGGEVENNAVKIKKYLPVPNGHLGEKNCISCRFFITSPAFFGGLAAVFNEIALKQRYVKEKEKRLIIHLESLEDEEYDAEKNNRIFTKSMELEQAASNLEIIAKETGMYAHDGVYIARLIDQCKQMANKSIKKGGGIQTMLVANTESRSIDWSIDETNSEFHQLTTVCENATIYALSDASLSNTRRTQLIDKMAYQNGLDPSMCMLTPEQQLEVGNQMSDLLKHRLGSWDNVEKVMNSDLLLSDFDDENQLVPLNDEVKSILLGRKTNQLYANQPMLEKL